MTPTSGVTALSLWIILMQLVTVATKVERRSYDRIRYAGEHIHVGSIGAISGASKQHRRQQQQQWRPTTSTAVVTSGSSTHTITTPTIATKPQLPQSADCPVEPPCFCIDGRTKTWSSTRQQQSPTGSNSVRDDRVQPAAIVSQRITCGVFGMTSSSPSSPATFGSRRNKHLRGGDVSVASSRRFPRFVESNDAVERQVSLSYSGLTTIPGAAFHALKVSSAMQVLDDFITRRRTTN